MPNYLRDLWLGNICESERMPTSPEYRRQCEQAEALREQRAQGLPDDQCVLLDQYTDAMYDLGATYAEDAFVRGVAVGLRLIAEAFHP